MQVAVGIGCSRIFVLFVERFCGSWTSWGFSRGEPIGPDDIELSRVISALMPRRSDRRSMIADCAS